MSDSVAFRQRLWRWHFFAGLLVCPFAIVLAITGSIYLFKPQIDDYHERGINALGEELFGGEPRLSDDRLVAALLASKPDDKFKRFTLAKKNDRTVEVELQNVEGAVTTYWVDVFSGKTLFEQKNSDQFLPWIKTIHGELLLGNVGSYVVELMASWLVVLIVTGLYLWMARPLSEGDPDKRIKGMLLPSLKGKKPRKRWFSVHGAVGLWFAVPILLLLLSGLPWTQLWGSGFERFKSLMGWEAPAQEWVVTLESKVAGKGEALKKELDARLWQIDSRDDDTAPVTLDFDVRQENGSLPLSVITAKPDVLSLTPPVYVIPPKSAKGVWSVRSMSQLRSQRVTLHYDQYSGEELLRINFEDQHPVQRFVAHGISLHEGALFGWMNQLLGVLTALAVITMSGVGFYIWLLRRPAGALSAPKKVLVNPSRTLIVLMLCLGVFLPAAGISFLLVCVIEWLWLKVFGKSALKK